MKAEPHSYKVALVIKHPTIDPGDVSRALSLAPSSESKVGHRRTTSTGEVLDGTYGFTTWIHAFDTDGVTELADIFCPVIGRLQRHASYFLELVRQDESVELFCEVFASRNWEEGFHHTVLRRLADMGIDLHLDVYSTPDAPKD
jgi:hypothetical protein